MSNLTEHTSKKIICASSVLIRAFPQGSVDNSAQMRRLAQMKISICASHFPLLLSHFTIKEHRCTDRYQSTRYVYQRTIPNV